MTLETWHFSNWKSGTAGKLLAIVPYYKDSSCSTVGDHLTPGPTCRLISLTDFQNDQTSTAHNSTNITLIKVALEVIKLLELGELINYTFFVNKYGIS